MILTGILSNINLYVNKIDDIRLSINDIYMTLVMTGWMILFMSLSDNRYVYIWFNIDN